MSSKYFSVSRPIDIGTFPKKEQLIKFENFSNRKKISTGYLAFGVLEYPDKLSFEDINRFELIPEDLNEYVDYFFWDKYDKDKTKANKSKDRYMRENIETLKEYRNQDTFAGLILLLRENEDSKITK
jgi:hypothetical protein